MSTTAPWGLGSIPGTKVPSNSVTEWDVPIDGAGPADTASFMVCHDPAGQIWIRLQVGTEHAFIRPATLESFAKGLEDQSYYWSECHWDLDLDACVSLTCRYKQGLAHIGRLAPWQQTRTRRVDGVERDREILRLHAAGLSRGKIAVRVGWSESTVGRVIRDQSDPEQRL